MAHTFIHDKIIIVILMRLMCLVLLLAELLLLHILLLVILHSLSIVVHFDACCISIMTRANRWSIHGLHHVVGEPLSVGLVDVDHLAPLLLGGTFTSVEALALVLLDNVFGRGVVDLQFHGGLLDGVALALHHVHQLLLRVHRHLHVVPFRPEQVLHLRRCVGLLRPGLLAQVVLGQVLCWWLLATGTIVLLGVSLPVVL